mgnify:CR=1 FL=1|jgi:hypothetical protein
MFFHYGHVLPDQMLSVASRSLRFASCKEMFFLEVMIAIIIQQTSDQVYEV